MEGFLAVVQVELLDAALFQQQLQAIKEFYSDLFDQMMYNKFDKLEAQSCNDCYVQYLCMYVCTVLYVCMYVTYLAG